MNQDYSFFVFILNNGCISDINGQSLGKCMEFIILHYMQDTER